ncbi:MAG: hypothetical protein HZA95_02720 [Candidatus Vogelbacteria bacterium]|nr:hypothetical protein [Candidatus Vogelbacteria bacterium]
MKYPWTAISLTVIWLSTTYMIIKQPSLHVNQILLITLIGTIIIALIGFRSPTLRK